MMIWFFVAACRGSGAPEEGLALVEGVLGDGSDEEIAVADLLRLRGELLAESGADATRVEASYREAVAVAQRQGALAFELRAATSLARHLSRQERGGRLGSCSRPSTPR
jgi:hypothetical protein